MPPQGSSQRRFTTMGNTANIDTSIRQWQKTNKQMRFVNLSIKVSQVCGSRQHWAVGHFVSTIAQNLILIQVRCLERSVVVGKRLQWQHQPVAHLVLSCQNDGIGDPMCVVALSSGTLWNRHSNFVSTIEQKLILIQLGCLERCVVVGKRQRQQHQPVAHLVLSCLNGWHWRPWLRTLFQLLNKI